MARKFWKIYQIFILPIQGFENYIRMGKFQIFYTEIYNFLFKVAHRYLQFYRVHSQSGKQKKEGIILKIRNYQRILVLNQENHGKLKIIWVRCFINFNQQQCYKINYVLQVLLTLSTVVDAYDVILLLFLDSINFLWELQAQRLCFIFRFRHTPLVFTFIILCLAHQESMYSKTLNYGY